MQRIKLVGAVLAALGMAVPLYAAATSVDVREARLGKVAPELMAARMNLGRGSSYVEEARLAAVRGVVRSRQQQTYKGVPVYGRSMVVTRDRTGTVLAARGVAERDLAMQLGSIQPRLTAAQAQAALQDKLGQRGIATGNAKNQLFVYPQAGGAAKLVYRVSYLATLAGRPSRPTAIVDATTGEVIRQWEGLTDGRRPPAGAPVAVSVNGPGGNALTGQYSYDGSGPGQELLAAQRAGNSCYLRNDHVATYNLAGGQNVALWAFGCGGTNPAMWTSVGDAINDAYSPINDAHHFGGVVHDMYSSWFAEPPLKNGDGSPMQLSMWVHYGTQYGNAFWDGSEMVFGDGDAYFYPFVVLDITGHEISHGFTEQHSALEYTGQSGGMNEAFSDMAGEAVKYFDRGANDFMVGSHIVKPATVLLLGMTALRDMCTPSNDGMSIDTAADYTDDLDVHYSSGVYNRAFCLLAKTSGWGTRKAFEVFHDANAMSWGPMETFDGGACGVEDAATARGYTTADVIAAFAEVGVGCRR